MSRNERFPPSFQFDIGTLVPSLCQHIAQKYRDHPHEIRIANTSLAHFVKVLLSNLSHAMHATLIYAVAEGRRGTVLINCSVFGTIEKCEILHLVISTV
jgi:hypothetical protein